MPASLTFIHIHIPIPIPRCTFIPAIPYHLLDPIIPRLSSLSFSLHWHFSIIGFLSFDCTFTHFCCLLFIYHPPTIATFSLFPLTGLLAPQNPSILLDTLSPIGFYRTWWDFEINKSVYLLLIYLSVCHIFLYILYIKKKNFSKPSTLSTCLSSV